MKISRRRHDSRERGIALLLVIFALLLLSAVALSMIYAANIETGVGTNFRDKQIASYAASSGLQVARDLVRPGAYLDPDDTSRILKPGEILQGLPSLGAKNVFYIINPSAGETVAPWDAANAYADPELCHENVLGLTSTGAAPCTGTSSLPSGSAWYASTTTSATPFAGLVPSNFKWVRVQLKTDNATPIHVGGSSANGAQVCWNGTYQVRMPGATNALCNSGTGVSGVIVTDPGAGYTATPDVTISGGGGSSATAHAVTKTINAGQILAVNITNPGNDYTTLPTIQINGDGVGAAANVFIAGGHVQSIDLANRGTGCYTTPPAVSVNGGNGVGATAEAVLATTNDCLLSVAISGNCSAWANTTSQVISFTGGGGSGAQATTNWGSGGIFSSGNITTYGSGYTSDPTGVTGLPNSCKTNYDHGNNTDVTFSGYKLGKRVASINVTNGGTGYTANPSVTFANGGVGDPKVVAMGGVGHVTGAIVTNPGSGYTWATVTISGGGGTGATASATIGSGTQVVDHVVIDSAGTGYTSEPTVTISGGAPTSNAAGTATINGGANMGRVYLITAMGEVSRAKNKGAPSRSLMQMEAANPPPNFNFNYFTGALTIDGPNPQLMNIPNSSNFKILGNDANSCGGTKSSAHPAVGVYDNAAVNSVTHSLSSNGAKSENYIGTVGHSNPDVENVFNSLGEIGTTPRGMNSLADVVGSVAARLGTSYPANGKPISAFNPANTNINSVTYIDGDLTIAGNSHGYGVLVVTGEVILSGDYSWNGPIFVIGKGIYNANGGGNGQITGALIVAKTNDASGNQLDTLGSPTVNFSGGGGNGIQYDHCWADDLMAKIPFTPPWPTKPLHVLSVRSINY